MTALPDSPFTRAQAEECGLTRARLAALLRQGSVRHVLREVYAVATAPDTTELRTAALTMVVSTHHVIVDRTAAWLHGIDALTWAELATPPPVEVCALRGRHPTRRPDARSGERDLVPRDVTTSGGVRVTTPLRTAMDLGCRLRRREAYATLNEFARLHGVGTASINAHLPRFQGRRGVIQLRELTQLIEPRVESPRESWTFLAIRDANLPRPEPQYEILDYRLDFAYPHAKVAVEYDGEDFHAEADRAYDEARRAHLRAEGWHFIVLKAGDFTGDRLDRWLRELRTLLAPEYSNLRW